MLLLLLVACAACAEVVHDTCKAGAEKTYDAIVASDVIVTLDTQGPGVLLMTIPLCGVVFVSLIIMLE